MNKLTILAGLVLALALALPGGANAVSFSEVKKLIASDAQGADWFGHSVALSGNNAIVGAHQEDAGGAEAGAAYVFERDQGGPTDWGEVKKLTASDAQAGDWFAYSVAISGDTAIVGALEWDMGGVHADAAYIFERNRGGPATWGEVKKLTASDAQAGDWFGWSVAISGETAIVGALEEDAGGARAGAAYVFERDLGGPGNWGEVRKLTASDAQDYDWFGSSVAIHEDTAVVGSDHEGAAGPTAGAAYVFERDQGGPGNWGEVKKLLASDAQAGDRFGRSVTVSEDTAVVGAPWEDSAGDFAGAAYVFERNRGGRGNWGEVTKLIASDAQETDYFGYSVAVSGDTAIVGALFEDAGGPAAGATYVFERPVEIDIRPGSHQNTISTRSQGIIAVAILSSADFDAPSDLDEASLAFGRTGEEESLAGCARNPRDVNGDSLLDQVCHFRTQDTGFQVGDIEGILRAQTLDGLPIEASDSVRIVH